MSFVEDRFTLFHYLCKNGHFELAREWWDCDNDETFQQTELARQIRVFGDTCANGHLDIAQWLASQFGFMPPSSEERLTFVVNMLKIEFSSVTCANGHLECAQWLWNTFHCGKALRPFWMRPLFLDGLSWRMFLHQNDALLDWVSEFQCEYQDFFVVLQRLCAFEECSVSHIRWLFQKATHRIFSPRSLNNIECMAACLRVVRNIDILREVHACLALSPTERAHFHSRWRVSEHHHLVQQGNTDILDFCVEMKLLPPPHKVPRADVVQTIVVHCDNVNRVFQWLCVYCPEVPIFQNLHSIDRQTLLHACANDCLHLVKLMLVHNPGLDIYVENGVCLFAAMHHAAFTVLQWLLETYPPQDLTQWCTSMPANVRDWAGSLSQKWKWKYMIKFDCAKLRNHWDAVVRIVAATNEPAVCDSFWVDIFHYVCDMCNVEFAQFMVQQMPQLHSPCNFDHVFAKACLTAMQSQKERDTQTTILHLRVAWWVQSLYPQDFRIVGTKWRLSLWSRKVHFYTKYTTTDVRSEDIDTCGICYEQPAHIETHCKHAFCEDCMSTWWYSMKKKSCPYCRTDIQFFTRLVSSDCTEETEKEDDGHGVGEEGGGHSSQIDVR